MKKASDFKIPFSWEERRPVLLEKALYIPPLYDRHHEWKKCLWEEIFGNNREVAVEYCSGNGQWIVERARQQPEWNWVAVEKRFDRARKIWARGSRENVQNLFVVCGEALIFSRYYAPQKSVSRIFINFPDPWPKKRHAKHRLIREEFLEKMAQLAKGGTKAMLVTDDVSYLEQMIEEVIRCGKWRPHLKDPYFTTEWPEYGDSFFEALWREKGRKIYYFPCEIT